MKNAQDAVREIKEWPKLDFEYLVEHEDGSIGFVDYVPPVVVCSRDEFRAAKGMNNKVTNAVRCFKGIWPGRDIPNGYLEEYLSSTVWTVCAGKPKSYICTRAQFEAEARRQGYVEGFEGHPDDVAFKGEWDGTGYPPPDTRCEFKAVTRDRVFSHNNFADDYESCTIKYASENGCHLIDRDGAECFMDSLDYHITFRPLKSDRERWVEAADKLVSSVDAGPYLMLETVYDALISGELPTPEAK